MRVGGTGRVAGFTALLVALALLAWLSWRTAEYATGRDAGNGEPASVRGTVDAQSPGNRGTPSPGGAQPGLGRSDEQVSAADAQCQRDRRAQYRMARERIDATASPEDAATRALLTSLMTLGEEPSSAVHDEVIAALRRWPNDVDLAWLAMNSCHASSGCDGEAALAYVQRLDGDNAFAWLPSLAAAHRARDVERFSESLHRAANAPVYDSRMGTVFLRLRPVLGVLPFPESCAPPPGIAALTDEFGGPSYEAMLADLEATVFEHTMTMPAFQGVFGCRAPDLALTKSAKRDCMRLLTRMARGDTLLERAMALPQLIETAPDDHRRAHWREQYRRLRWFHTLGPEMHLVEGFAWRTWAEGEIAVLQDYAARTGRWPPPADWLPDDEYARELVLGVPATGNGP